LVVECLRLGVGHASTVRPDPSTLGMVGERGSRREDYPRPVLGSLVILGRWLLDICVKFSRGAEQMARQ
jgi:hypothetical protein